MISDQTTCKVILKEGTTREQAEKLFKSYTKTFDIVNFNPHQELGKRKYAFAVVDLPGDVISQLMREKNLVTDVDVLTASYRPAKSDPRACCASPSG